MKYEWLLFDLDDTLLDFNVSEKYALAKALKQAGILMQPAHLSMYEKINRKCWNAFDAGELPQSEINNRRFSQFLIEMNLPQEDPVQFGNYYLTQLSEKATFMAGAKELLEEQHPKYHLGIITNGLKEVQRPKLQKSNLTPYFKVIIVSDEIGVSKPAIDFFDYTFHEMGLPAKEKVLVIGDSLNSDIKGGNNYGLDTCWYNFKGKQNNSGIQPTYEIKDLMQLKTLGII